MSVLAVVFTLAGLTVAYRIHRSAHIRAGTEAPATPTNGDTPSVTYTQLANAADQAIDD